MLARAALLSVLLLPAAFVPPTTAANVRIHLPPMPHVARPMVELHQLNLSRMQNRVEILQAGSQYGEFLIRQPGFPDTRAANLDALMGTLAERQRSSPHEALKIAPLFEDPAHQERFSAQLKTKRPSYFRDIAAPQLVPIGSGLVHAAYGSETLRSVNPSGVVYSTADGRWAQDLTFGTNWHSGDITLDLSRKVRILSTLRDLVEDIKNYLLWAYDYLVQSGVKPSAKAVVDLALERLAENANMPQSELRSLVTVQFDGLDVVLLGQDASSAA
jgi:hypothetical protein